MRGRIASHPYPGTWQTYPVPQLPVIAVVGPTAAGKSDLAVDLALELGGEVITTDSMQLYREWTSGRRNSPWRSAGGCHTTSWTSGT
ncbi:isopentenyl transferase family protein [Streptosporangium vulgare]|uniref:isopentenyl transferase family protein n=1 Tax=Streptosporangium vulgare TaxID=46190 RepID=UPI0031D3A319